MPSRRRPGHLIAGSAGTKVPTSDLFRGRGNCAGVSAATRPDRDPAQSSEVTHLALLHPQAPRPQYAWCLATGPGRLRQSQLPRIKSLSKPLGTEKTLKPQWMGGLPFTSAVWFPQHRTAEGLVTAFWAVAQTSAPQAPLQITGGQSLDLQAWLRGHENLWERSVFTHAGETSKFRDVKETGNCRVSNGELPGCGAAQGRRLCVSGFLEELCAGRTPAFRGECRAASGGDCPRGSPCQVAGRSRKATGFPQTNRLTPVVGKVVVWDPHGGAGTLGAAGAPFL